MSEDNMEELQRWSMEIVVKPGKYSYGNESACNEQFTWAHGPKDSDIRTCGGTVVPEDEVDETREDEDGEWQALKAGRIWNPTKGQA